MSSASQHSRDDCQPPEEQSNGRIFECECGREWVYEKEWFLVNDI